MGDEIHRDRRNSKVPPSVAWEIMVSSASSSRGSSSSAHSTASHKNTSSPNIYEWDAKKVRPKVPGHVLPPRAVRSQSMPEEPKPVNVQKHVGTGNKQRSRSANSALCGQMIYDYLPQDVRDQGGVIMIRIPAGNSNSDRKTLPSLDWQGFSPPWEINPTSTARDGRDEKETRGNGLPTCFNKGVGGSGAHDAVHPAGKGRPGSADGAREEGRKSDHQGLPCSDKATWRKSKVSTAVFPARIPTKIDQNFNMIECEIFTNTSCSSVGSMTRSVSSAFLPFHTDRRDCKGVDATTSRSPRSVSIPMTRRGKLAYDTAILRTRSKLASGSHPDQLSAHGASRPATAPPPYAAPKIFPRGKPTKKQLARDEAVLRKIRPRPVEVSKETPEIKKLKLSMKSRPQRHWDADARPRVEKWAAQRSRCNESHIPVRLGSAKRTAGRPATSAVAEKGGERVETSSLQTPVRRESKDRSKRCSRIPRYRGQSTVTVDTDQKTHDAEESPPIETLFAPVQKESAIDIVKEKLSRTAAWTDLHSVDEESEEARKCTDKTKNVQFQMPWEVNYNFSAYHQSFQESSFSVPVQPYFSAHRKPLEIIEIDDDGDDDVVTCGVVSDDDCEQDVHGPCVTESAECRSKLSVDDIDVCQDAETEVVYLHMRKISSKNTLLDFSTADSSHSDTIVKLDVPKADFVPNQIASLDEEEVLDANMIQKGEQTVVKLAVESSDIQSNQLGSLSEEEGLVGTISQSDEQFVENLSVEPDDLSVNSDVQTNQLGSDDEEEDLTRTTNQRDGQSIENVCVESSAVYTNGKYVGSSDEEEDLLGTINQKDEQSVQNSSVESDDLNSDFDVLTDQQGSSDEEEGLVENINQRDEQSVENLNVETSDLHTKQIVQLVQEEDLVVTIYVRDEQSVENSSVGSSEVFLNQKETLLEESETEVIEFRPKISVVSTRSKLDVEAVTVDMSESGYQIVETLMTEPTFYVPRNYQIGNLQFDSKMLGPLIEENDNLVKLITKKIDTHKKNQLKVGFEIFDMNHENTIPAKVHNPCIDIQSADQLVVVDVDIDTSQPRIVEAKHTSYALDHVGDISVQQTTTMCLKREPQSYALLTASLASVAEAVQNTRRLPLPAEESRSRYEDAVLPTRSTEIQLFGRDSWNSFVGVKDQQERKLATRRRRLARKRTSSADLSKRLAAERRRCEAVEAKYRELSTEKDRFLAELEEGLHATEERCAELHGAYLGKCQEMRAYEQQVRRETSTLIARMGQLQQTVSTLEQEKRALRKPETCEIAVQVEATKKLAAHATKTTQTVDCAPVTQSLTTISMNARESMLHEELRVLRATHLLDQETMAKMSSDRRRLRNCLLAAEAAADSSRPRERVVEPRRSPPPARGWVRSEVRDDPSREGCDDQDDLDMGLRDKLKSVQSALREVFEHKSWQRLRSKHMHEERERQRTSERSLASQHEQLRVRPSRPAQSQPAESAQAEAERRWRQQRRQRQQLAEGRTPTPPPRGQRPKSGILTTLDQLCESPGMVSMYDDINDLCHVLCRTFEKSRRVQTHLERIMDLCEDRLTRGAPAPPVVGYAPPDRCPPPAAVDLSAKQSRNVRVRRKSEILHNTPALINLYRDKNFVGSDSDIISTPSVHHTPYYSCN